MNKKGKEPETRATEPDPFKMLPRDLYHHLLDWLSLKDMVSLSTASATLWKRNQAPLFLKALQEAHKDQSVDGLNYLADMIEFNRALRNRLNYKTLATTLIRATHLLGTMVQSDPFCTWKIADLCGLDEVADASLPPDKQVTVLDRYGRGRLFYKALGGQVKSLRTFIQKHHPDFDRQKLDPSSELAFAAAIGGHIPVLEYLRDTLKYPLKNIVLEATEEHPRETLVHFGIRSGDRPTVAFLLKAGVNPKIGLNPALCASNSGQWEIYPIFAKQYDPTNTETTAVIVLEDALRTGNLKLAAQLFTKYKTLKPEQFKEVVVRGGISKVFKSFLNKKYLSLNDRFENGATVQHLLAAQGHLDLLRFVLNHKDAAKPESADKSTNGPAALQVRDEHGRSLLHYAASGGQWVVYCYLRTLMGEKAALPVDNFGNTIAHAAAQSGAVWFLKHLAETEAGRALIKTKNDYNDTLLHSAADCPEPHCLMMLIDEFEQDPRAVDVDGNTVAHLLAKNAIDNPDYWLAIFVLDKNYPDAQLLDTPNKEKATVRSLIKDFDAEKFVDQRILESYSRTNQNNFEHKK